MNNLAENSNTKNTIPVYDPLTTPNDLLLESVRIKNKFNYNGHVLFFDEDVWDCRVEKESIPGQNQNSVFRFDANSAYKDVFKYYVLNHMLKGYLKLHVINQKYNNAKRFFGEVEKMGYVSISEIPHYAVARVLDDWSIRMQYTSLVTYKIAARDFLEFYESRFAAIQDRTVFSLLNDIDKELIKNEIEANKTPALPKDFFDNFVENCQEIMRDSTQIDDNRIMAAVLLLFATLGMRTGEVGTIDIGGKQSIYSKELGKELFYLHFYTYKKAYGDEGTRPADSYMPEQVIEAYDHLERLCKPYREKLGVDSLVVFRRQTKTRIDFKSFYYRYRNFIVEFRKQLWAVGYHSSDELNSFKFSSVKGNMPKRILNEASINLKDNDVLLHPDITQFRVTVCNDLYLHGVPMIYIKKHMTHLTEQMTSYYIRPEKTIDNEITMRIYQEMYQTGAALLGPNADPFVAKINEFLESGNIQVAKNTDELILLVAEKYPLRAKKGGVCIRCGNVVPCANDSITDQAYCALGMCPNQCHMYFMLNSTLETYEEQKAFLQYNIDRGYSKAVEKETNKLRFQVRNNLLPELDSLNDVLNRHGKEYVIRKFPELNDVIDNYSEIRKEAMKWA